MAESMQLSDHRDHIMIQDPPIARLFFSSTRMAWLWLLVRVWVGFQWLNRGRCPTNRASQLSSQMDAS